MDRCDQCGFGYEALATGEVPGTLRAHAERYGELLLRAQPADLVRTRPTPEVWSALEYTCHVRDVLLIQRDRVVLALVEDTPSYPPMYRDERVSLVGYQRESVAELVDELAMAANLMAKVFGGLSPEQLGRRCIYSFPRATERDVAWLGRHTVHETAHHLGDVQAVLTQVGGRAG
ncbi:MAG TPA: DinB family protein [Acidimicrobiales bacterium]